MDDERRGRGVQGTEVATGRTGLGVVRAAVAACVLLLGGCAPLGPQALLGQRPLFNAAVQETDSQQLLLNIVRQRYNDPVFFLDVSSISSGSSRVVSANLLGKLIPSRRDDLSGNVGGILSETPVIFYTPNSGEKFMRQMLRPIDVRTLALVLQSGWSIERVLLIGGEAISGLRNGTPAYRALLADLRELQREGLMQVGLVADDGRLEAADADTRLGLAFAEGATGSPAYRRVCLALAVACDGGLLELQASLGGTSSAGKLGLATRSLYTSFYHLAQAVDVPSEDQASGAAAQVVVEGSGEAGAAQRMRFRVHHSTEEPLRAAVRVNYRDRWFYIEDDDRESKVSFALVSLLVTLQAGDPERSLPILSLPLN